MSEFEQHLSPQGDDGEFLDIVRGEFDGRTLLVAAFDNQRDELMFQLSDITQQLEEHPDEREHDVVTFELDPHRDAFKSLMVEVLDDKTEHMHANIKMLASLIADDTERRVQMMNELLGFKTLEPLKIKSVKKIIQKLNKSSISYDAMLEAITDYFELNLSGDIHAFMRLVHDKYGVELPEEGAIETQQTPEPEVITQVEKKISSHVTDVAKIATGVTIALAIDKLLKRRH